MIRDLAISNFGGDVETLKRFQNTFSLQCKNARNCYHDIGTSLILN